MNELDLFKSPDGRPVLQLFSGSGGGILADIIEGNTVVCAVEYEAYPVASLCARQNDGVLPPFPIWSDVRSFRADNPGCAGMFDALRSIADELIVAAGFPCTDISPAGRGEGLDGEASGLYREALRIVGEIRPGELRLENSSALVVRGLDRIAGELAQMGYVGRNGVVSAADAGAPHQRARTWIVANARHVGGRYVRPSEGRTGRERERPAYSGQTGRPGEQSAALADAYGDGQQQPQGAVSQERGRPGNGGEDLADTDGGRRWKTLASGASQGRESYPDVYGLWWSFDPADLPDADGFRRDGWAGELGPSGRSEPSYEDSEPEDRAGLELVLQEAVLGGDTGELCLAGNALGMAGRGRPIESELGGLVDGLAPGLGSPRTPAGGKLDRLGKGIPARVPRLKALGNGQVPAAAVKAWEVLQ